LLAIETSGSDDEDHLGIRFGGNRLTGLAAGGGSSFPRDDMDRAVI